MNSWTRMISQTLAGNSPWASIQRKPTWPQSQARHGLVAHAKKKSGKKKKKSTGNPGLASPAAAPRIGLDDSNNISVRKQISFVRRREQMLKGPSAITPRSGSTPAYKRANERRRVEVNARERQVMREEEQQLARRSSPKTWSPGIESIYGTKTRAGAPVLIVDGYNVMKLPAFRGRKASHRAAAAAAAAAPPPPPTPGTVPALQELSGDSGSSSEEEGSGMDAAEMQEERKRLEDRLRAYGIYVHARVVVVWDGMGYVGRAKWTAAGFDVVEQEDLSVVYTSATEADTYIGRAAREFVARGAYHALVVTSDTEVQTLAASPGVYGVQSDEFVRRLCDAEATARREEREARARAEGRAAARGTGGAQGVLAGLDVSGGGTDGSLALQAMISGFENAEDYMRAEELGQNALEFYKGGRGVGEEGAAGSRSQRTDHDRKVGRTCRGREPWCQGDGVVDVEFAALKDLVDD